jgi:hypothetical protein
LDEVREDEVGCLFDEIQNLVEPTERRTMGEQHSCERHYTEVLGGDDDRRAK